MKLSTVVVVVDDVMGPTDKATTEILSAFKVLGEAVPSIVFTTQPFMTKFMDFIAHTDAKERVVPVLPEDVSAFDSQGLASECLLVEPFPTVGAKFTVHVGSDSYPWTITRVTPSGKTFEARQNVTEREKILDRTFGEPVTFRKNASGRYVNKARCYVAEFGVHKLELDPSF